MTRPKVTTPEERAGTGCLLVAAVLLVGVTQVALLLAYGLAALLLGGAGAALTGLAVLALAVLAPDD